MSRVWNVKLSGVVGAIAVCGNRAYVGTGKCALEAVDLETGNSLWKSEIEGAKWDRTKMMALDDVVGIVLPNSDRCVFLSAETGERRDSELPIDLNSFAPHGDSFLTRRMDPMTVVRYGKKWPFEELERIPRETLAPIIMDSESCVFGYAAETGTMVCLDPDSHENHWGSQATVLQRRGPQMEICVEGRSAIICCPRSFQEEGLLYRIGDLGEIVWSLKTEEMGYSFGHPEWTTRFDEQGVMNCYGIDAEADAYYIVATDMATGVAGILARRYSTGEHLWFSGRDGAERLMDLTQLGKFLWVHERMVDDEEGRLGALYLVCRDAATGEILLEEKAPGKKATPIAWSHGHLLLGRGKNLQVFSGVRP